MVPYLVLQMKIQYTFLQEESELRINLDHKCDLVIE